MRREQRCIYASILSQHRTRSLRAEVGLKIIKDEAAVLKRRPGVLQAFESAVPGERRTREPRSNVATILELTHALPALI